MYKVLICYYDGSVAEEWEAASLDRAFYLIRVRLADHRKTYPGLGDPIRLGRIVDPRGNTIHQESSND